VTKSRCREGGARRGATISFFFFNLIFGESKIMRERGEVFWVASFWILEVFRRAVWGDLLHVVTVDGRRGGFSSLPFYYNLIHYHNSFFIWILFDFLQNKTYFSFFIYLFYHFTQILFYTQNFKSYKNLFHFKHLKLLNYYQKNFFILLLL